MPRSLVRQGPRRKPSDVPLDDRSAWSGAWWREDPMRALLRLAAALVCVFATARAVAAEIAPLPMQEIAAGVFVFAAPYEVTDPRNGGNIANVGFIIGAEAVAVIDTGGSLAEGQRLLASIRARTDLPIRYVINTHVHPDHVLGNAAFAIPEVTFVGHHNLPEALAARAEGYLVANRALVGDPFAGTRIVPPTRLVESTLEIDLGGRILRLEAWPTAHTNTDVTVLDSGTGTWFLGDLLFVGHVPALDGRLEGWIATLRSLRARPAQRVVPGHGPASVTWPEAVAPVERYLAVLERDVRLAIREGETMRRASERAARSEAESWSLFDSFNPRNATTAFQELEWE
jgi:quinoprotein relay system zinc metallohydrolase 2